MPRYIDADKLRKQISETYEYEFPTASGGFDEFATKIIPNIINNAITADVVPVVRGEWKQGKEFPSYPRVPFIGDAYYCSNCEDDAYWDTDYGQQLFDYCPNCGAKMEGKE